MICLGLLASLLISFNASSFRIVPSSPSSPKSIAQGSFRDLTRVVGSAASVVGVSLLGRKREAFASDSLSFPKDCSDSVVVLRGPNNREVVIIGTAHISEESVEVVKRTINSVNPDVVMIELDVKRLGRVVEESPDGKNRVLSETESARRMMEKGFILPSGAATAPVPPVAGPGSEPPFSVSAALSLPSPSTPIADTKARMGSPVQRFLATIQQGIAALAGQALKRGLGSFYDSVEKLGFVAGGEFQTAIQEAFARKVPVLLGDQDVDTTLQNLAAALSTTSTDSFLKLIDDLDAAERALGIELPQDPDVAMSKEQIAGFVEKLKTRRALDLVMGTVQREAPAIYQAMIGDRDAYMASSIAGQHDSKVMVAVCGMAHLSGIERNLATKGFSVASRKC